MISARHMVQETEHMNLAEAEAAADFFSRLPFKTHFHVVEADRVPKTSVQGVSVYAKMPGAGDEPIGERIVEIPDDIAQWELGNPHTEFTAYVPNGSVKRGEALVASGNGAAPCRSCHGADLKGHGTAPPLAGRSASYLARQLYDIQHGTRFGPFVAPMLPEVAHMNDAERIAIVAYLTSLGSQ
jgi:cytochrome c553